MGTLTGSNRLHKSFPKRRTRLQAAAAPHPLTRGLQTPGAEAGSSLASAAQVGGHRQVQLVPTQFTNVPHLSGLHHRLFSPSLYDRTPPDRGSKSSRWERPPFRGNMARHLPLPRRFVLSSIPTSCSCLFFQRHWLHSGSELRTKAPGGPWAGPHHPPPKCLLRA